MKRGFTFVELVLVTTLTAMIFAAVGVAFGGVWRLARETSDDLQSMLHARALHERMLYAIDERGGLSNATNATIMAKMITSFKDDLDVTCGTDGAGYEKIGDSFFRVHLAVKRGRVTCRDHFAVSAFGGQEKVDESILKDVFGKKTDGGGGE